MIERASTSFGRFMCWLVSAAWFRWFSFLCLLVSPSRVVLQAQFVDNFETLSTWNAVTSHGDASRLTLSSGEGRSGKAMVMNFSFLGHMGSAAAENQLRLDLPPRYQISFDIRGKALANNFIIRLLDSLGNVWVVMRSNYVVPRVWTKFTIRQHQIQYGWGPGPRGELRRIDRIMLMIDVVEGGKGTFWIDNLRVEPLEDRNATPPRVSASSSLREGEPALRTDSKGIARWHSTGKKSREWLRFDFGHREPLGGLLIDWDGEDRPRAFDVLLSDDGSTWRKAYRTTNGQGARSRIVLEDAEARLLKLVFLKSRSGAGYGIKGLEIKGPEFAFSMNDFFAALAAEAPKGYYPKYLLGQQSYWTVIGAAGDTKEALINEQGMIETDKQSFSLEPFLYTDEGLVSWHDVKLSQSLTDEYLPIPSVRWELNNGVVLTVQTLAGGPSGESVLFVRYRVENKGSRPSNGKLFIAVRPFQVNPPWQTFTIVGGAVRIDSITCAARVRVNGKELLPLSRPSACGAAELDQGDVTDYLANGTVPPSRSVHDHFGHASAALQYDFDLTVGGSRDVVLALPFHKKHMPLRVPMSDRDAGALYERVAEKTAAFWHAKLDTVRLSLPARAGKLDATIKSNLAYILINADGVALQPGSRSYERSWLRDGALMCSALLEMGITEEVRRYLDWYATYQFPDGMIPAIVERRGADPTPEHDSHGEFLYAIGEYFSFTHDTTWLAGKWDHIQRTVRYIQGLRRQCMTDIYRNGTAEQRACFGLVPASISHEGYTPKPMHSYWDDFFILRGLKDATRIAGVLGRSVEAKEFASERDDFRRALYGSMRLAMKNTNVRFIPGCVELGDFSGLSTTIAISPCNELGFIPEEPLRFTFDESYRMFLERKANTTTWDSYLPYEARFIGAYVLLEERDRANEILQFLMRDRRPEAWNGWGEVVWKDYEAPKNIGDMPHSWAASDFIRSVRSMLVYERELDEALVIGAGIPESWLSDPNGVSVRGLPTYYGRLTYTMRQADTTIVVELSGDLKMPRGGLIVRSPRSMPARSVGGNGERGGRADEAVVRTLPARVVFSY